VTLRRKIEQAIRERGPIPFSRYMEICLYDPELGYYSRDAEQFGKAGDFYTSSDVHAVFGRLLARQFEELWRVLGSPSQIEILELGPGRGLFAQDVLDWSEKKFPAFFAAVHYSLGEGSPALRRRLQTTLERHFAAGKASLCSDGKVIAREGATSVVPNAATVERALAPEIPIIVFANEFFDALPVEVLSLQGELRISENDGRLLETWQPASVEALEFLDRYGVHPQTGERIEALLIAQRYMSQIAAAIKRGFIIAIDYGYTRQEQLAGRHRGTIAAYRQHSMSANPYEAPGEQDITAHVNFTALGAAAEVQGMQVQPLLTQSQFLLGIGEHNQFADAFEECRLPQEHAKVALQLKHLVTPEGMGESFQVLVASKGISAELVSKLSGLTFGKTTRP
jgi:SAM-dependent MidA family methyltransferase